MSRPLRIAVVMPPTVSGDPASAVASWTTVTGTLAAVHAAADVEFEVFGRHLDRQAAWSAGNDTYSFLPSDRSLAAAVAGAGVDLVHVHGLFSNRLVWSLRRALPRHVPIVLQHHGEPVPGRRARWAHAILRRRIAGYLFTGAELGHAQPFIDGGVFAPGARLFDVLESASTLPARPPPAPAALAGTPSILWVGRLIEGKDPLTALAAFAAAAGSSPHAHLHLLATDRTLEPAVRAQLAALGPAADRVHLHHPVAHAEMPSWYAAADVYLSTSRREAANYSLIEALSFGCAPAVSDIPPHRAIVGTLAPCFPVGDAAAAGDVITAVTALSRGDVIAHSATHLAWGVVARQLLATWQTLACARVAELA